MIVVGVDGSVSALDAVRWAAREARRRGLPLRLVHGYQPPAKGDETHDPGIGDKVREQGRRRLADAWQVADESGVHATSVLESGPAVPVLVHESRAAALMVIGTRGLGGFAGLLVGATAVSLAGRAHCPLVVVRGAREPDGPVVLGVDGQPDSDAAVGFAFAQASTQDAQLVAVHVWHDSAADTLLLGHAEPPDFDPAQQQAYETLAERLACWQEKFPDVHVTREVVRDHPSRALLRYADDARLVVVGTRGRGGFRGLLLGSTSRHLLHHAACPVAVVRTEPDGE